jgi:hypothetical protein
MIFFSYSLFGTQMMYTQGMIENARILNQTFPDARVQIYYADDVPNETVNALSQMTNVNLINVRNKPGIQNMFDRFASIDDPECSVMIVRDADSRPHARDIACIQDFLSSDKLLHIIRDHQYHTHPIMGGLWGIKKKAIGEPMNAMIERWVDGKSLFPYSADQDFLALSVYPNLVDQALIHDRFGRREPAHRLTAFNVPITNNLFCGQVHRYNGFVEYTEFLAD